MVRWNLNATRCPSIFLCGTRVILRSIIGAIRSDLAERSHEGSALTLDEYLGLVQVWLAAYPQPYVDGDYCVEELGGRLFADALLVAASGGEFSKRWRGWLADFDDEGDQPQHSSRT
jgi:hypothetical protein